MSKSFAVGVDAANSGSTGAGGEFYLSETNKCKMESIVSTPWYVAMWQWTHREWCGLWENEIGYPLKRAAGCVKPVNPTVQPKFRDSFFFF